MCYTSATTGNPKGVEYTHRALVLHSMMLSMADTFAISERDTIMPIVPMFHANAWGMPYAGVNVGANQVLVGPQFTNTLILDMIEQEKVTKTACRYRRCKPPRRIKLGKRKQYARYLPACADFTRP